MIDMNPEIAGLVKDICTLQFEFPEVNSTFPYVSLTEIGNSTAAVVNGEERYIRYDGQLDVWDTAKNGRSASRCMQLATKLGNAIVLAGFDRGQARLIKDPSGLHRCMIPFHGWVDTKTKKVYRGGF
jgi:hypothetical protein